jgi:hypothetical protein
MFMTSFAWFYRMPGYVEGTIKENIVFAKQGLVMNWLLPPVWLLGRIALFRTIL